MDKERALTAQEVAELLRVKDKTVRGWLERGELAGFQLPGGDWRIWPSTLERFYPKSDDERGQATQ